MVMANGIITVLTGCILSTVSHLQYVAEVVVVVEVERDTHPTRKSPDFSDLFIYLEK